ncbi:MAG TPA: RidA family protein [Dongiaceae bacterium]|nr:RidA family protein [Dongiaceae bacterium]
MDFFSPTKFRGGQPGVRTQAVRQGNLVLLSGQMSLDESGKVAGKTMTEQARNVFDALQRALAGVGGTMADVVKHNVFFVCDDNSAAIGRAMEELDSVRIPLFQAPGPTTTEVRAKLDVDGALVMVDAWAVLGGDRKLLTPPGHWGWKRKGPFSHGWKVGDMIFVGGQRSLDRNGNVLGAGDIEVQTDHAFRNLDTMLRAGGGDRNNLMRQNTFFKFFAEGPEVTAYWEKMTAVRRRYMSSPSAAGAGLRISGFPDAAELIQVEGIGVLGENKQRLQPANHWDWSIPGNKFTQGWKIGNLAFIGGQISADDKAKAVGKGDMAAQTRNVFNFIKRTLAEGGLDESDVAKLYIYYHAEGSPEAVTAVRRTIADIQREFYGDPGPAVTAIRVAGFAFEDLLIEIEAMAVTRD